MDTNLTFHDHVKYIQSKTIGKLRLLSKVTPTLPRDTCLMVYKTLIRPHFEYCDVVYNCLSEMDNQTLQRIQNACLKNIPKVPRLTSTSFIHQETDTLQLAVSRDIHTAIEMFKIVHDLAPRQLSNMYNHPMGIHQHNTRRNTDRCLYPPKARLHLTTKSFRHRGYEIWYKIPDWIRSIESIDDFKDSLIATSGQW